MTLNEIAKLAGVSRTTASYIINGKAEQYRISEKTQQKVLEVVNAHNYRPNHAASSLRAGSSQSLGLIIPDLENTSYAKIAKLLELNARTAGYQVIISCSDDDPVTEVDVANLLLSRKLDALIVASALPADNEFYKTVQAKGTPVIAIDRALDDEYFASVISEDLDGAHALTNALLEQPISSIGLIGAEADLGVSIEREQGFQAALNNHLKTVNVSLAYGEQFSQHHGALIAQQWIDANCFPEAILATSYTLFDGILDCLLKHPDVMAKTYLATFGDNRLLDFLPNKIQSLPQQFDLIADHALQLALSAIQGHYQQGVEVVPRKVIRR